MSLAFFLVVWSIVCCGDPTATGPTKNPLAEEAQEVASERYVAFAVR
jgi:hypothetical protein